MLRKIALILLLVCAALFSHYGYGNTVQTVEVGDQLHIVYILPFENVSVSYGEEPNENGEPGTGNEEQETENSTPETVPRQPMYVSLYVDCSGVHVKASSAQEPLESADVSVYRIPKSPLLVLFSGSTDTNGTFVFNTTESKIGLIVSKKGYKYHESRYGIPILNCTVPEKNETVNPKPETENRTPETVNTTKPETQENKTNVSEGGIVVQPPAQVKTTPGAEPKYFGLSKGDLLLGLLAIVAVAVAYLVFGGKSVDPMLLPGGKEGDVSVDPMPLPKPAGKGGNVSVDPMPLPKPAKGKVSLDPKKKKGGKSVDPMPLP